MFIPSGNEWVLIGLLGILLFGPDKLPTVARSWGRWIGEFNRARARIEAEIRSAADETNDSIRLKPAPHLNPPMTPTTQLPENALEPPVLTPAPPHQAEDPYHLAEAEQPPAEPEKPVDPEKKST